MNNVKNKIIKYITENAGTSFVEIEKYLMRIILNTKETELIPVQRTITLYFGMGGTNKLLMSLAA